MSVEQFAKLVYYLFASKGRVATEFTCQVWWDDLGHYPDASLVAAFTTARRHSDFISVAGMVKLIEGDPDEKADEAFSQLCSTLSNQSSWTALMYEALTTVSSVNELWDAEDFTKNRIRKDFIKCYSAKVKEASTAAYLEARKTSEAKRITQ